MTSSTAPGVTHRWRGRQIGEYIMRSVMQPTTATGSRCPVLLRGAQKQARRKSHPERRHRQAVGRFAYRH
jgi:hypothetical protein